ncbi:hypothetical protein CH63R_02882 [Colletotrichum higginsianum IMI 349063]|uniref:Uncharacterized protein n=1 Tax=Colletotrichum higginsianum (strain IMI 349063) TaxID=759273 RepID=A0A1B7YQ32_COLHI|nr:hypothetical protein CH63R_02882 [Colletotrichum higginsianum IMI 349063]OBR14156.1 hypothetical protein CH63R_02882 [Colletotrichum higginsianum IMI 349063]
MFDDTTRPAGHVGTVTLLSFPECLTLQLHAERPPKDGLTKNLAASGFARSDSYNMNTELDVRVPTLGWNGLA